MMAIEFNYYSGTADVFVGDLLVGEIDFSISDDVVFNGAGIDDVEQILSKMKALQDSSCIMQGENIMNLTIEQLEQQSRDATVAYLQDSGVRLEFIRKEGGENWSHKPDDGVLRINNYYYRIAHTS